MRTRGAIGVLLLGLAFLLLTTCQLQFNKSSGNNFALQVVVPGGASGGGKGLQGSKSLTNGTTLTVKISQEGTSFSTQQTVPINGNSSIDFSFSLSSTGTYDVTAYMDDASGDTLAQKTTKLTVPSGNYPVVLTLYSNLLFTAVLTDLSGLLTPFVPPFSPTTYSYNAGPPSEPATLTLTTVDPNATITFSENGIVIPPTGPAYTFTGLFNGTYTIQVTAQDGTGQAYTLVLNGG